MTASPAANANSDPSARGRLEEFLAEINALAIRLKRGARATRAGEVPAATRAVLHILKRQGAMAVPALARARGTSRQNIQTIINRLEREGWVSSAGNPAHKRSDLVFLTESGAAMLERGAARERQTLDLLLTTTSEAELISACQLIHRLREALGAKPAPDSAPRREAEARRARPSKPEVQVAEQELPVSLL